LVVVVVVHDLGLAAAHRDRIALLGAGRSEACGPPAEMLTSALLSHPYGQKMEVVAHPGPPPNRPPAALIMVAK
jgi:iron complex transport system ATP-binding protein